MNVITALVRTLLHADLQRVSFRVGVVTHTGDLPGDLHPGLAAANREPVVGNFMCDMKIRSWRSNRGKLVAEVSVHRLKPIWQFDGRRPTGVEQGDAVVDVLHLRGFDRGMVEVFVSWIQWMVNPEVLGTCADCAADTQVAIGVQKQAASGALSEDGGTSTIGENDHGVGATVVSHSQRIAAIRGGSHSVAVRVTQHSDRDAPDYAPGHCAERRSP